VRSPASAAALVGCTVLFAFVGVLVHVGDVSVFEEDVFRVANELPAWLGPTLKALMQLGSYQAIPAIAIVLVLMRRFALARDVVLAAGLAYGAMVVAKLAFARQRPTAFLDSVISRGTFDETKFGFPSGHVAVATAIVAVVAVYVPARVRRWWWALVPVVMVARMYVGAHLPLDVIGGALIGLASASLIHLILGVEDPARDVGRLSRILRDAMPAVRAITPLVSDAKASSPYIVAMQDGSTRFMKVSSRANLFGDQLHRTFRRLYFTRTEDLSPYVSNKQKVDHEAFVLLLAERAGAQVPALDNLWYDRESDMVFLFQQRLSGHSFDSLDPTVVSPGLLREVFEQVATLHRARIAHRDLRLANLVLDEEGQVHLIDFGYAETSSSARQMHLDRAEVMISLSMVADPVLVVDAFRAVFTDDDLIAVRPFVQTQAVGATTRSQLRHGHNPVKELARRIDDVTGSTAAASSEKLQRVTLTQVAILVGALLGIHFLLPQVGELRASADTLKSVNLGWAAAAVLASVGTYLVVGFNQCTASAVKVPYLPMMWTQFAASFMNRFTPLSVGTIVLSSRLMVRCGMQRGPALAAAGLPTAIGLITSILLLVVAAPSSASKLAGRIAVSEDARILLLVIAAGMVTGVLALPVLRHKIKAAVSSIWDGLRTLRSPSKAALLTLGCLLNSAMYVTSLWASLHAFGVALSPLEIFTVYFAGALIGQVSPVPGGLGVTEAALVAGLSILGVATASAISAVLVYRLATYWLPVLPGAFAMRWLRAQHYV